MAQLMVVPLAPIAALIAFTITWMFASLLPQTTNAAPLLAFKAATAVSIPLFNFASAIAGAVTATPNLAARAKATAPVSDGLWVYRSSALLPVRLIILSN